MNRLTDDIRAFLEENGFACSVQMRHGLEVIVTKAADGRHDRMILPIEIADHDCCQAIKKAECIFRGIRMIRELDGAYPLIVVEDRWRTQKDMTKKRLLAHLEVFFPIYARNCEVRKIDKAVAREFLERNHSYGHAACRHCYGLFFKRHTGHVAKEMAGSRQTPIGGNAKEGSLMAVATFSNARKWVKGGRIIRSYEWTRYASLPEVRLSGGMGRLLKAFIKDVEPDDIMSYADLEWSEGEVYMQLGFELEGMKEAVTFHIAEDWQRIPIKRSDVIARSETTWQSRYFQNFGSNKYRLKLTDYE